MDTTNIIELPDEILEQILWYITSQLYQLVTVNRRWYGVCVAILSIKYKQISCKISQKLTDLHL